MVRSDSTHDDSSRTSTLPMEAWFAKATAAERDAMSALQLDYRFKGDNLGNVWWLVFQSLGFKHKGTSYEIPDSAPVQCRNRFYTGAELYAEMDRFAIPQLTSAFQDFPLGPPRVDRLSLKDRESQTWWRDIRDEMIFRRFQLKIDGFQLKELPSAIDNNNLRPKDPLTTSTNKRRSTSKDAGAELYMRKTKKRKSRRNDRKESEYDRSCITFPTIQEYAKEVSESMDLEHVMEQEAFLTTMFDEWKFQTVLNHSLLLYGVGSKRSLLNQFAKQLEEEADTSIMVIDGFHKDVTIDGICDLMIQSWLPGEKLAYHRYNVHLGRSLLPLRPYGGGGHSFPSINDADIVQKAIAISNALARRVEETQSPYCLIFHNIDGVGLRNSTAQESLAALVSHSTTLRGLNAVRLVASVDHINSPALLWDSLTYSKFRWIWKQAHTYRPYVEEATLGGHADEKSLQVDPHRRQIFGAIADPLTTEHKAIFTVLASLAPRHTEALQQLAGLQASQLEEASATRKRAMGKDSESSQATSWVQYKTLFRQCQRKCIVHADQQLRRFLQELKDHGVVEQSNAQDATDVLSYRIPHAAQTLKDIMNFSHNSIT